MSIALCEKCNLLQKGEKCTTCSKFYCFPHLPESYKEGIRCTTCTKFFCSQHMPDNYKEGRCVTCIKFFCEHHMPKSYRTGRKCALCTTFYCDQHVTDNYTNGSTCEWCSKFYCESHVQKYGRACSVDLCEKFACSDHLAHITCSCSSPVCTDHRKKCTTCGKTFCKADKEYWEGKNCAACKFFYCPRHFPEKIKNGKSCSTCNTFNCQDHSCSCKICEKSFCNSHKNGSECTTCKRYLCSPHVVKCYACAGSFCAEHSQKCGSCGKLFCSTDVASHHVTTDNPTGFGVEYHCCDNKINGKYEGQWIKGKKYGCGVFTWTSGQKIMCLYNNGKLVLQRDYSEEATASMLVQEKIDQWEKIRIEKEKQLSQEMQSQKDSLEKELSAKKDRITAQIKEEQEKINQAHKALELQKAAFEAEQTAMKKFAYNQNSQLKLNVGGKIFETSVATLTKYPSMLQNMFSGKYDNKVDSNGCIFIDADGELFGIILNFLRRGILPSSVDKTGLLAEAEYYALDELISVLKK